MKQMKDTRRSREKGNVLFLILIAVALFAALSYAVTQSTRGGGDASKETDLISGAQITQYPASVRTAVVRMIIGGTAVSELEFNPPSDFASCTNSGVNCVFHPSGGGATYAEAPGNLMANGGAGTWHFNGHFEVVNIGTSVGTSASGNEITAFLPGVSSTVCSRINTELGISGDVIAAADISANYDQDMDDSYTIPSSETILGQTAGTNTLGLEGQPFGCFQNGAAGEWVYYHVLIEQ